MSAITMTIDVEMVFGNTGLGSVFWLVWETMRMTDFYSAILIVSILGISFTLLFEWSKKFLIPWQHENQPAKKALIPKYNCNQWFCDGFPRLPEVGSEPSACFTR